MRTIEEIRKELENRQVRSAWDKGVTEYALDLLDNLKEYRDYDHRDHKVDAAAVEKEMLNGVSDWKQYSYDGNALIYDGDIAKSLCSPSEYKKVNGGEHRPNSSEQWLDVQARALSQACRLIKDEARRETVSRPKIIYFDTETTGLSPTDEILSISIVDNDKNVLLDTLVKPERHETWEEAQKINGITPEAVRSAPTIGQLSQKINAAFRDCDMFVAYNTPYDMQYIKPVLLSETLKGLDEKQKDCMADFAQHYGEPDNTRGGFKHKKLVEAAAYFDVKWEGTAHGSLADTLATREVWLKLHPEYAPEVKANASLSNKAVQQAPRRKL